MKNIFLFLLQEYYRKFLSKMVKLVSDMFKKYNLIWMLLYIILCSESLVARLKLFWYKCKYSRNFIFRIKQKYLKHTLNKKSYPSALLAIYKQVKYIFQEYLIYFLTTIAWIKRSQMEFYKARKSTPVTFI